MDQIPEARCPWKLHGRLIAPGVWEVKCRSARCGAGIGIVVLHQFSTETGELLQTMRFRDPALKGGNSGTNNHTVAVRSA